VVFQPEWVFMATQAVVRRAVDTPLTQDLPGRGSAQLHLQDAAIHAVVHFGDLWPGLIGMRNELQLDNAGPRRVYKLL
jgi:hypothetical protein